MTALTLAGGAAPGATALSFANGRITATPARAARRVDCTGLWVLPGIVDAHGDGFERHIAPRRGALKDAARGLVAVEAELAANGITTAMLAQFWSWEGGLRGPEAALRLMQALPRHDGLGTDMQVQLRVEIHLREDWPRILDTVAAHGVRHVVFNDHLPHDRLAAGKRPPALTGQALKAGRNPEAHWAYIQALHDDRAAVWEGLPAFAAALSGKGVRLGSHDDATAQGRARWREMGARVAEFPETRDAAAAARAGGDAIVLGAPNVMRGNSHKGNVSAAALIADGLCDALASDYHYPAPLQAVFRLIDDGMAPDAAWRLVSDGPARLLGLDDRGRLDPGLRADIAVIDPGARRVLGTIAGGRITYAAGRFAAALAAA